MPRLILSARSGLPSRALVVEEKFFALPAVSVLVGCASILVGRLVGSSIGSRFDMSDGAAFPVSINGAFVGVHSTLID